MTTLERVAKMVAEYKGIDESTVTMESTFKALDLDSLDLAELSMNLEDELGIELDVDESVDTVGAIVNAIEAKL